MVTFVLVPGAWLGGWCWKYLTPLLRDQGHEVCTPTLTGLGEREHLSHVDIDLETHVRDVVNVLEYEDLEDVILVGHSYAGIVVTDVAERIPERLSHIAYLDALVPMDDEPVSATDFYPPEEWAAMEAEAAEHAGGWPMPDDHPGWVGITDEDTQWLRSNAVPHPLETFTQEVTVENPATAALSHTYILCSANGMEDDVLDMIRQLCEQRDWELRELATGHWPMVSTPEQLAERLCTIEERNP